MMVVVVVVDRMRDVCRVEGLDLSEFSDKVRHM